MIWSNATNRCIHGRLRAAERQTIPFSERTHPRQARQGAPDLVQA